MTDFNTNKLALQENGFSIVEGIFQEKELNEIINFIEKKKFDFSERQLLNRFPELQSIIFKSKKFKKLYNSICDNNYFLSKAIYFNKPSKSNWFVSYHQDLSISVKNKIENEGYNSWTSKKRQLGVIPPLHILENSITFRIHLDDADDTNGCLKVIPKSHTKGIVRSKDNFSKEGQEINCTVQNGGVMLMKPLLLHSSQKSTSLKERRVIHLEFCNQEIPMSWLERKEVISYL